MKFGSVPLGDAQGAVLAHGVPVASLSKGIVLHAGHLETLANFGFDKVSVARLEDGDVGEDVAALQLAQAMVGDPDAVGVRLSIAKTGRVNIMAVRAGLLRLDAVRIGAINAVDPMLTIATLPDLARVSAGVMVATIKVISYGVAGESLAAACQAAGEGGALRIQTGVIKTATLIETHHGGGRMQPKGRRMLDERLDRLGCSLIETLDVPHTAEAIAQAMTQAKGESIFLLTASATSDVRDVGPEGVRQAGGVVRRFGIPVDPGNLLFLGGLSTSSAPERPVIGLPGCARSPALNGADFILERVICGVAITDADINAMGVGGLLKDIPDRGRSRTER